jgi:RimJ/RimL family protein N-acetyltransferase
VLEIGISEGAGAILTSGDENCIASLLDGLLIKRTLDAQARLLEKVRVDHCRAHVLVSHQHFGFHQGIEEIEVRPFSIREDYELMLDYFYKADEPFLRGMGVDRLKLPLRDSWLDALLVDHEKPDKERDRFYLVWIFRGRRVGHSSINNIIHGIEAFIHLHLWNSKLRKAGLGMEFVRRSANFFFERFNLKKLVCEPWAENPAPNRVLEKLGFTFVRRYRTIPGVIAYEQDVNRYELDHKIV